MKYDLAELMKKALEKNKKIFKKASDISFEKEEYLLDYYKSQSFHELRYNKINEIGKMFLREEISVDEHDALRNSIEKLIEDFYGKLRDIREEYGEDEMPSEDEKKYIYEKYGDQINRNSEIAEMAIDEAIAHFLDNRDLPLVMKEKIDELKSKLNNSISNIKQKNSTTKVDNTPRKSFNICDYSKIVQTGNSGWGLLNDEDYLDYIGCLIFGYPAPEKEDFIENIKQFEKFRRVIFTAPLSDYQKDIQKKYDSLSDEQKNRLLNVLNKM